MMHQARMMHHAIRQNDKESLQDYYSRTTRSLATQHLLDNKLDPDIDQARDFTYKVDRKIFQTMITNMDSRKKSEIRKHHHRRSFPTSKFVSDRAHKNHDRSSYR